MTDAEYLEWLQDPEANRCVTLEATHSAGVLYFSNKAFITRSTDTLASTPFSEFLTDVPEIKTYIDGRTTVGDFTLSSEDGDLDYMLDLKFQGYSLVSKFGDPSWEYDDFRNLVDGINGGISAPNHSEIEFTLYDKREAFNTPIQTSRISASGLASHDYPVPISLGKVFNAEPQLINSTTHQYQVHEGTCTISAVRDNGVSISYTDAGNGTFTLSAQPAGKITCDVTQADNTVKLMVEYICNKLSFTDIDSANLTAFANTSSIGIYIKDETTASRVLDTILQSAGGFWRFDRLGLLQLSRLDLPTTPIADIDTDAIFEFGLTIDRIERPNTELSLNYQRNWAVQDEDALAGAVTEANRALYSTEYSKVTSTNSLSGFPQADAAREINTLFELQADAQTECDRRANIRSARRYIYEIDTFVEPFELSVGDTVTVYYDRYGLSAGEDAVIISMEQHPTDSNAKIKVWA